LSNVRTAIKTELQCVSKMQGVLNAAANNDLNNACDL